MNRVRIGIPRTLFYYSEGRFLKYFLEALDFEVVISKETDEEIIELGKTYKDKDYCLPLIIYLGHIAYLKDKCDYVINIKLNNTGLDMCGCYNYIATTSLIKNNFNIKVLDITIDHYNYRTLYKELLQLFNKFDIDKRKLKDAYLSSKIKVSKEKKQEVVRNTNKLYIDKLKVLLIGHEYTLYDNYLTTSVINYLNNYNIEVIYSNLFDKEKLKEISKVYCNNLNIKGAREKIGALLYSRNYINGIVLFTNNCMEDALVYEYIKHKIDLPILNVELDEDNNTDESLERFTFLLEKDK